MPTEVIIYIVALFFTVASSIKKATVHLAYLKEVKPKLFSHCDSYLESFLIDGFNLSIQLLMLPFIRSCSSNESIKAQNIRREVRQYVALTWIGITIIVIECLYILFVRSK